MRSIAVRSHTHQKVTVKGAPGSMVTLAAVDNGVLQVSDFNTPDPYAHFYAKRALEVNGYDIYPLLFPEVRASLSSTGGDADWDMKKGSTPCRPNGSRSYLTGAALPRPMAVARLNSNSISRSSPGRFA
jgi:uncharacterized protein YfaS (alpha-2-macroglobulin family)